MGGDHGLPVTVPAALSFLASHPDVEVMLVGQPDQIEAALAQPRGGGPRRSDRLRVVSASEVVQMDEAPAQALRSKRDSSMRIAVELLKKGEVNRIAFDNTKNPPGEDEWRIWNIWLEKVLLPEIPPEPIELPHHQRILWAQRLETCLQPGTRVMATRGQIFVDAVWSHPCGKECVPL